MNKNDMIKKINDYYEGLDESNFERVLSAFHDDMIYKHPKIWDFEENQPEYHGKEAFKTLYLDKRGNRAFEHQVVDIIAEGDRAAILGTAPGRKNSASWVAFVKFKDGRIYRFMYGTFAGKPPSME
jgi:ketosteroid isomerase-like protein